MKISNYSTPLAPLQHSLKPQTPPADATRFEAEAKLRELIAQRHSVLEPTEQTAELGKHLDIRA